MQIRTLQKDVDIIAKNTGLDRGLIRRIKKQKEMHRLQAS